MNWSLLSVIYYSSLFTAKGLNLYQVLAPNSFSYVDGYISAINRNVHSLVYERVCWSLFRFTRLSRFKKKKLKDWTPMKLSINHITIFNIPSETCFAVEVHVWKFFLAIFVLYFWINISFGRKKNSAAFSFYMFLLLIVQSMAQFKWHDGSVKNVHVDPTLLFDYQVCWCLCYSSVSFFFPDIFVMPNFPLSLERTDTTFRLLQKMADFICLW